MKLLSPWLEMSADPPRSDPHRAGDALRRLVHLTSHRSGAVLALMNEAAVTLPQLLLLSRVEQLGSASLTAIGDESSVSIPALSQMIDRLVRQGWLDRAEDPADRRRKAIRVTPRARDLIRNVETARSADFNLGLSLVSEELRTQLATILERAVIEIESARLAGRRNREATS
jgi:DNA-binding MarR family transcriptional regulator